ncbi:MAG: ATP synthase F0 subunit B [Acidobacteria bacterium]|nr:ATP synthase F0 subunit B [Acidobacteriota bacterium]
MNVARRKDLPSARAPRIRLSRPAIVAASVVVILVAAGSPAFAAEEGASNLPKIVNFTILATILVLALRKPLASYLEARALQIREQLAEARTNREEASRAAERATERSRELRNEVETAQRRIAEAATAEARRIVEAAEEQAKKIGAATQAELNQEVRVAERRLAAGAARAAVEITRTRLRDTMSEEDHRRLLDAGRAALRGD